MLGVRLSERQIAASDPRTRQEERRAVGRRHRVERHADLFVEAQALARRNDEARVRRERQPRAQHARGLVDELFEVVEDDDAVVELRERVPELLHGVLRASARDERDSEGAADGGACVVEVARLAQVAEEETHAPRLARPFERETCLADPRRAHDGHDVRPFAHASVQRLELLRASHERSARGEPSFAQDRDVPVGDRHVPEDSGAGACDERSTARIIADSTTRR